MASLLCFHPETAQAQRIELRDSAVPALRDSGVDDLPGEITGRLETFFSKLLKDPPETAFFALFQDTDFMSKGEIIEQIVATSRSSTEEYGDYTSYEFTGAEQYGEKAITVAYLTTMPKKLLRWRFFFYAPSGTDWTLANLKVDDMRNYLPRRANPQPPPDTIQVQIEKFFIDLLSDQTRRAMETLLKDSAIPEVPNKLEEFVDQVENSTFEYGNMLSYELYDRTQVGQRHVLLTYFNYLKKEPLRWQFLYRLEGPGDWILVNLRVDDMLDEAVLID